MGKPYDIKIDYTYTEPENTTEGCNIDYTLPYDDNPVDEGACKPFSLASAEIQDLLVTITFADGHVDTFTIPFVDYSGDLSNKAEDSEVLHQTGSDQEVILGDDTSKLLSDFATSAQGEKADTAIQLADLEAYLESLDFPDTVDIQLLEDQILAHLEDFTNPHQVTKAQVGLSNVDNTSDYNKPVSSAQSTAITNAKNAAISHANAGLAGKVDKVTGSRLITSSEAEKISKFDEKHYKAPVATLTELKAIPEVDLDDKERRYVEAEGKDYFYDVEAITGNAAPDDQTNTQGFWKTSSATGVSEASELQVSNVDREVITDAANQEDFNNKVDESLQGKELLLNKSVDFATVNNIKFPTVKAVVDYIVTQGYATEQYVLDKIADIDNPNVDHTYTDIPTMISLQNEQLEDDLIKVLDASADGITGRAYYYYEGTTAGTIEDYYLLSSAEVAQITSQAIINALGFAPANDSEVVKGILNPDGTERAKVDGKVTLPEFSSDFDDTAIQNELSNHETRITALEGAATPQEPISVVWNTGDPLTFSLPKAPSAVDINGSLLSKWLEDGVTADEYSVSGTTVTLNGITPNDGSNIQFHFEGKAIIANGQITTSKFANLEYPANINLIDGVTDGIQLNTNGTTTTFQASDKTTTDFIEVSPSQNYSYSAGTTYALRTVHYDASKNYISKQDNTGSIITPVNGAFVRISFFSSQLETAVFQLGASPSKILPPILKGIRTEKEPQILQDIQELQGSLSVTNAIDCWGDSLTAGAGGTPYPTILQSLVDSEITVNNFGVGGETSRTIAARQGGMPMIVNNFTIPSSGGVVIQNTSGIKNADGNNVFPGRQNGFVGVNPCNIKGIEGNLSYNATTTEYTFTRLASGDAVVVDRPTVIITNAMKNNRNNPMVMWMGQNDGVNDATEIIRFQKLMLDYCTAYNKEYLIIGLSSSSEEYRAPMEAQFLNAFGRRFINIREYLSIYGIEDAGIEPTATDITKMNNGEVPPSLLTDTVHFNTAGYTVIANVVFNRLKEFEII